MSIRFNVLFDVSQILLLTDLLDRTLIPVSQRAFSSVFLKDPAEISLVMITAHFSDLLHRKGWLMDQQLLCVAHPEIDQIFGRSAVIDLTEDLGQVAGTVVHGSCDQVQVDILCIILNHEVLEKFRNLSR